MALPAEIGRLEDGGEVVVRVRGVERRNQVSERAPRGYLVERSEGGVERLVDGLGLVAAAKRWAAGSFGWGERLR